MFVFVPPSSHAFILAACGGLLMRCITFSVTCAFYAAGAFLFSWGAGFAHQHQVISNRTNHLLVAVLKSEVHETASVLGENVSDLVS
jgi:hypothetical protein